MKFLKKINKGLILAIIVLLALTIYLVNVENQRKADKPDIKAVCEEFIALTDKYSVLPEEMQKLGEKQDESKIEEYVKQMKEDLGKIMISNEEAIKIQQQVLEENLRNGYNELEARTKQERKIQKISKYEFDGNQVTVSFENEVQENIKYFDGTSEQTENKKFDTYYDTIILQKIDGKWKVVYSNMQFEENQVYHEEVIY